MRDGTYFQEALGIGEKVDSLINEYYLGFHQV